MSHKAIIFDFDGVITESMDIKIRGFTSLFRNHPEDSVMKIVQFYLDNGGLSRFEIFRVFYRDFLGKEISQEEEERLGKKYSELCYKEMISCAYVKGAYEFLENAYSRYMLFVVSGTPHEEMNSIIDARELRKYFKGVWGSPRSKGKLLKIVLKRYRLKADEVIFIGDAPTDYRGAQEASIKFIARIPPDGYNPFNSDVYKIEHSIEDLSTLEHLLETIE